jgi:hypothetical protein
MWQNNTATWQLCQRALLQQWQNYPALYGSSKARPCIVGRDAVGVLNCACRVQDLQNCALREAVSSLLSLNWDVHHVALAVHEQEGEIGGLQRVGEALKDCKVVHMLPVEFQDDVTRL